LRSFRLEERDAVLDLAALAVACSRSIRAPPQFRALPNAAATRFALDDRSGIVDLGALELVGIVDVDGLPLGEEVDGDNDRFVV
jgi:hypothetical protein